MSRPLEKPAATDAELHPLLAGRWSPRAFDADAALSDADLRTLLEAARWAPSWGNGQPWAYVGGRRPGPGFDAVAAALTRGNAWAHRASALLVACHATTREDGTPETHAAHDLGQASAHLTVQAEAMGLRVHQMAGFDPEAVRAAFAVPADRRPLVAVAIGTQAAPEALADPRREERERRPRTRRPLAEIAHGPVWGRPLLDEDAGQASSARRAAETVAARV